MTNLIIQISRYLMILLIALDTYYNFRFFSVRDEEGKDRVCGRLRAGAGRGFFMPAAKEVIDR